MDTPDLILHGTWLPTQQQFVLWGEVAAPSSRKGSRKKIPPHSYQAVPDALRERLRYSVVQGVPLVRNPDALDVFIGTIWLPTVGKQPLPSPDMLATGVIPMPEGDPVLAPWQISGLLLPPLTMLDMLLALVHEPCIGADMQAWRLAALLAMEIVAEQQVMPTLQREGFTLRALWQPRPSPSTVQKLVTLTRSLPPICRAITDDPTDAPSPRVLIDDCIKTVVDRTIRDMPSPSLVEPTTPGGKWLTALLKSDPVVKIKGAASSVLYESWQAWVRQGQVAGDEVFRVTFRVEPPDVQHAPWVLSFLLQATDDPSLLVPAGSIWREREQIFTYLERRFEQPQERLLRALGFAARVFPPLESSLRTRTPEHATLSTNDAFLFLKEAVPLLEQTGFGVLVPSWWQGGSSHFKAKGRVSSGSGKKNEHDAILTLDKMLTFNWSLALGDTPITFEEFEQLVALKQPLVQVRGQWVAIDPDQVDAILLFFKQQKQVGIVDVLRMATGHTSDELPPGIKIENIEGEGWVGEVLNGLRDTQQLTPLAPPEGLHATLRPYQEWGLSWLGFMQRFGLGACLADDMGLGKTIQTICLLLHQHERLNITAPALIVSPTSVIGNWQHEIQRFAPALRVLIHQGTERQQGKKFHKALAEYDVVLTSYPLLTRDRDTLTAVTWSAVVLDEAQNIKNPAAKQTQAARALATTTRIALTGTPVENRLSELWSIMTFLNPGYLGSEKSFMHTFARPIERTGDPHATALLKQLTTPFILRRLKTDKTIIADLPEKIEMKEYCALTAEQVTLYEATVREGFELVEEAEKENDQTKRRGLVLSLLMKLKQICNHPGLFLKDEEAGLDRSGKVERLNDLLQAIYDTDDRVLVFTQFAEMGKMLQNGLRQRLSEHVLFLHGATPTKERTSLVRQFQAPRGPKVFILSLKSGGTGLNLTAANHVVHFDRWWNPAVENQATDRAFRIGQTRNVQVHKFVCTGTLEEHIDQMIEKKRELAEHVLGADEGWLTELSSDQLRDLVQLRQEGA